MSDDRRLYDDATEASAVVTVTVESYADVMRFAGVQAMTSVNDDNYHSLAHFRSELRHCIDPF